MTNHINPDPNQQNNTSWKETEGKLPFSMTNDYLFCAMLQKNNLVLKSLICSLLHLEASNVQSIEITNPIELGDSLTEKTFILDIKVIMNSNTLIKLEMQVLNYHDWPERSLSYLCRSFSSQLQHGDDYSQVKPAIHISILDFTLFSNYPEFFANYYMMNEKNHQLYSDKLRVSVLCLTQINQATEEDKNYHIDTWARLFKCSDWRELQMLANNDSSIQEAVNTIHQISEDEKLRYQCIRREEALRRERTLHNQLEESKQQHLEDIKEISRLKKLLAEHGISDQ